MAITFLDEEEDIVAAAEPPKGASRITFLDEEEPEAPALGGFSIPAAPERPVFQEEPEASSDWDLLRGGEVALRQVPQLAYGVAGLVGATSEQITGYGEALRDFGFRGYKEWEESMEPISKDTDDITVAWDRAKQGDVGALVDWAQYGVGYALGQLGETAAVAVLGGLAGAAAGAPAGGVGAVPAAAGGAIAAAATKQGFKTLARDLVEKAIASQATKIVTREAERKGVKLTAEQVAKEASQEAIKRQAGKEIGSNIGIFGNAIGMQLGSIYGEAESKAQAEGRDLTGYDLARVWGTGLATGGVEGVVDKLGLDLLKGKLSRVLPEGRLAGAAVAGGVGVLGEAATEGVQTVGERFGAGKDILGDEALNEYINAAALGGLGGGVIGGAGGFVSGNPKENAAAKAKVAAEASKNIAPESSKLVADQADAVINEVAQETPDEKVARLQREAQEAAGDIELEKEGAGLPPVSELPPVKEGFVRLYHGGASATAGEFTPYLDTALGYAQQSKGSIFYVDVPEDSEFLRRGDYDEQGNISERGMLAARQSRVPNDIALTAQRAASGFEAEPVTPTVTPTPEAAEAPVEPVVAEGEAQPITATRTVEDAIRDKDTFIYNDQRGAVSVEDGVTVFRPFGTQDKFEIGINPNQTIGEIEGIQWARKGQVRTTPVESKPETATIIESQPDITIDDVDQEESEFEVPAALIEIEKSKTLNDLADLFDTGDSKVVQEGKRARKVSQTPEYYRAVTPQQINLANRLIDNALRIIDALPITDQQKQGMAEPFLLLDQDITNYENNPNYQQYKASIRTEIRPAGQAGAFPETETEVAAGIRELEQRAKAEAERLERARVRRPVAPPPVTPQLEPLRRVARAEQTEDDVAGLVDGGLVELYKGQPVLTQAGLEALPEAERPRLTPEARKIQIDTGASSVVAEAISKRLRIGVDQVPFNFQMPAGWVLEGDVYIPSRFTSLEELYSDFDARGAGHARFRTRLDSMVNEGALTSDARDMILATLFDNNVNDEFLMNVEAGSMSARAIRTYGRGGFGRQKVAGPAGAMIGYKPSLKLFRNTRKVYPIINERSAQVLSTFWHEYGHVGYYSLLDQNQKKIVNAEFNKTTKAQRQKFFEEGVADAKDTAWFRKYYAKNESEWFAQSFAEYVLTQKSDNKKLVPVFEQILDRIKNVFNKLFNRTETVNLTDIFDFILRGEAYGTKPVWYGATMMSREPSIYTGGGPQIIRGAKTVAVPTPEVIEARREPAITQQQVQSAINESRARREQNVEPEDVEFEGDDKVYAIAPSETIGKSLRDVLRIVSETNLTNADVFPPSEQTMQDVAAVLSQLDSPVLDSETVVSLESRGYGRDGNFSARRFPDGAIGVHDNEPQSVETYVHEASHSLTVDQIDKYLNWETSGSGKDYIDSINKAIADPATPEPVKRLFSLYTSTLDQLGLMEQFGGVDGVANLEADARYAKQKAQSRQRAGKIRKDLDNEQIYGLVDMREFVAQTFSSESFRDLLKTLKDPNAPQKSLWSAFVEAIQKILNLPKSSMAAAVIQASVDISTLGEVTPKRTGAGVAALGPEYQPEAIPTFTEGTPEDATLKEMEASMAKVDAASEAKGGKPETYKISEIASVWMDSGLGERELQDAIVEYTNLTPANAAKVAKAIAKQYGIQQQLIEAAAPLAEIAPEAEGAPRKSAVTKLIEQTTGVRKPVVKLQVSESAALKKQIQLKAREARETRKARKEAAEELAKAITDYVKANPIRGPINSRQAMSITKRALKLDVNNEAAVDRFEMYVERVIENANYDRDLADARALIKRAKAFAKAKDTQGNVKTTLEAIANIAPTLLDNPFEFNLVVQRYLLGLAPVTAKQYAVMPDADVRRYLESLETQIKDNQEILDRAKAQRILDKQSAYANEKGIPLDEAIAILNSEEFLEEKTIEKLEDLTKLLTAMAQESQKDVKAYDDSGATPKQKELISFMRKVNLDSLLNEQKKQYIRSANNLLANGATFGMEQFQSIALGQESVVKALKDKRLSNKLAAWISPIGGDKAIDTARRIAAKTQSEADTFKNIFGREAVGVFRNILGLNRLDVAQTDSNRAKEQIANEFGEFFKGLRKKYGNDATGFEAKGYAGIAGYLIQTDGNKTEAESIPYRRRLMEQNIVELRKSDKQADLAEADLKERALAQLTGTTNAEILSQLKALNPASYEQLMWVKDTMLPKWRDFLKEHDENFRNQANNYNNPDHLTITYKFPEGQLLPSEMEDVYQQDMVGMRIKQAANSIKRKDHPNLPVSKSGTIANIDINFGYNQYNALVDQVDKAYVAPAWEQVVAFSKDPNFEQVVGGRANALFVKNLLRDIQTSRSRQSITDDEAQMIAGGVRLARKISTQAVLGGFTQPLRQVPDQLSKLFFTTGRWDLITKNLLKTAEAAPLLNKFPIGRRGDAQAGTQYASQFSELARKVEASVTDRKWAQYRELMNRVGEFWMAPLRGSDVWAAKVSWMSYYESELNKKGIKMESWEREAELIDTDQNRKEAASYAEFAVDFYGGASDPTKMASLSKQTNNGWKEFAKLMFLPLNSFALQQKNSLISDLRDAYLRTGDRKASIAAISGTLAGMAAFHGMRIYIIGGLIYPAGKALLMGVFGIDMDEPDEEEKQKKLEDDWRKFKASMYGNIVAGGAGQFIEQSAIDAVNKATYLIQANVNPDELLNDKGEVMSFRQYEKDVSPLYRFRSFGTSEYSFGLADVLTEQAQRALAETQQIMTPEEMEKYSGNEQAYAMFSTMVEWLYFFRLMDTDVTRIARDLKRQMDKGVEEQEKEIRAIQSGR